MRRAAEIDQAQFAHQWSELEETIELVRSEMAQHRQASYKNGTMVRSAAYRQAMDDFLLKAEIELRECNANSDKSMTAYK